MSHIELNNDLPGILGPMHAYPEASKALNLMADTILSRPSATLSMAERELIASYVSFLNDCQFCSLSHAAVADIHMKEDGFSSAVWCDQNSPKVTDRLKSLLAIAKKVQVSGKAVKKSDVDEALAQGANAEDVHDTVLIAAAFCMFNRHVDGLGTLAPSAGDPFYKRVGERLATQGYKP